MNSDIRTLRAESPRRTLRRTDLPADPFVAFADWLDAALQAGVHQANAMTLATVSAAGRPSARMVLLRGFDDRGFCFYTNYESRKAQELAQNPWAALVFWWGPLGRQVRIEGRVETLTAAESDAYYNSRPLGSRLGAWASAQSQPIPNRAVLEQRLAELEAEYADVDPPRPPFWGGYRVRPESIEFWQNGPHRLHDRFRYVIQPEGHWSIERLSP